MNIVERETARTLDSADDGSQSSPASTGKVAPGGRRLRPLVSLWPYVRRYRWRAVAALLALLAAAIAGQGIVYQPTFIAADDLRAGNLVALALDQPANESLAVHAVYLPHRHPPAKVRAFIDFLASQFAPEPPWDRGIP